MLNTPANPNGTSIEAFDAIRAGVWGDRSQFYKDLSVPFYGANRPGAPSVGGGTGGVLAVEHAGRPQECL